MEITHKILVTNKILKMKILKLEIYFIVALFLVSTIACQEGVPEIGDLPATPQFTVTSIDTNNNYVIELTNANEYFSHLISSPGGKFRNPFKSIDKTTTDKAIDTIQFLNKGLQTITVNGLSKEGGGNSLATQDVDVPKDLGAQCTEILELLVGDCTSDFGKCWTWSREAGALSNESAIGLSDWFTSPEDGLQYEQYDDQFCFTFENSIYLHNNYGASVYPFDMSFAPREYTPIGSKFQLLEDEPIYETDHSLILVSDDLAADKAWLGAWDSGPNYGIVEISEEKLVLRSAITDANGNVQAGYFDFILVPASE